MAILLKSDTQHSDEIQDIISAPPGWLVKWGIVLFFMILLTIIILASVIRYPDVVKAQLKINSFNAPKPIVTKVSGKLIKLLVNEDEYVKKGDILAYIESTGDHEKLLALISQIKEIQTQVLHDQNITFDDNSEVDNGDLGELQTAYQTFYNQFLAYKSVIDGGFSLKKKSFLLKDLANLNSQQAQLQTEKNIQERDFELATEEYDMHKKLSVAKVETQAEFRQQESKYLSKKTSIVQTDASLISASTNYLAKQKEILDLENQMFETKSKFLQALNSLISQGEEWKSKYILTASQTGKLTYSGVIQENQVLNTNQEVFYINPGSGNFFGEMPIPQNNMGKVKRGQRVLIKLKSYPYEEYGMLTGNISFINDVPYKDSIFVSRVAISSTKLGGKTPATLKNGMLADAEIITEDANLLSRISRGIMKVIR